ncbi:MAG: aminoacyl--tRNA ligase-related protein [Candidatus Micrarchaeia archaeon]
MPKLKQLAGLKNEYMQCLREKGAEAIIPHFENGLRIYNEYLKTLQALQESQAQLNRLSEQFNKTRDKSLIEQSKETKARITAMQAKVDALAAEIQKIEVVLPNWIAEGVPRAKGDENELPLKYSGIPKVWKNHEAEFLELYPDAKYSVQEDEPFHHYDLVGNLVDQERAGEIAQSRFYYQFDELVPLDLAIGLYALEFFRKKGYADRMMIPPFIMRRDVEERITYFEAFQDTIFEIERDGLLLTPSSEHSIIAYYANTIFEPEQLPLRVAAWSPCFRREAGAHGKDTRGIFRVKQFQKVELHSFLKEGEDFAEIDRITQDVQEFMDTLGLPNRSVVVPSGEMDKRALKQVDVQVWMPGQGRFRETHSIATLGTWVSEKMLLRYRKGTEKELVRNVYATGIAVQRIICAIAENHYSPEGNSIRVPKPLQKYLDFSEIPLKK